MGFFDNIIKCKWSLFFYNDGALHYEMQNDSIIRMLGYIMNNFIDYGNPKSPWSIHIGFNRNNTSFKLTKKHFTSDGNLSSSLLDKIKSIDTDWMVTGSEPTFKDVLNNKTAKLGSSDIDFYGTLRKIFI